MDIELIEFMAVNGLLSYRWQIPLTIDAPIAQKSTSPSLAKDHPIIQYRDGSISADEASKALGIEEDQLFAYLVECGELFG